MTTYTWSGGSAAWGTVTDWTPLTLSAPNATTAVAIIANGGTAIISGGNAYTVGTLEIGTGRLGDTSEVTVGDNAALTVANAIVNQNTLLITNAGNVASLNIASGAKVTLSGAGWVVLSGTGINSFIRDAASSTGKLANVDNLIEGKGGVGNGQMALDNQAAGIIDANVSGGLLTLELNSAGATNEGLLEATGGGTLAINGAAGGTITQSGGTILAAAGASVILTAGAAVTGGTFANGGGSIYTASGQAVTLSGVTIATGLTYTGLDNTTTNLSGTIVNQGTLALASAGNTSDLRVANGSTLTGGGTVAMGAAQAGNRIFGYNNTGTETVTNLNNTILGAGSLGASNSFEFINSAAGTVEATSNTVALTITPTTATVVATPNGGGFVNQGLLEGAGAAGLVLNGGHFNNLGAEILASGTSVINGTTAVGNSVLLQNAVTISGGTLASANGGFLQTGTGATATLDATVANGMTLTGTFVARDNSDTSIAGSFSNTGTILLSSVGNTVALQFANNTTLNGGGTVMLDDQAANHIFGIKNTGSEVVTNVNNTIEGSGSIGYSNLIGFVNQAGGTIEATGTAHSLVISPTSQSAVVSVLGGGFVNQGLLEAAASAGLVLNGGRFINTGGTILASGTGDLVSLQANAIVSGGVLRGTGGGAFLTAAGNAATLDGSSHGTITLAGTYTASDNSSTAVLGTLNNTGEIAQNSTGDITDLLFADGATLTGGGTIALSAQSTNRIFGVNNTGTETVTNLNNTILGAGSIGVSNSFEFINGTAGVLEAASNTTALIITPTTATVVATPNGGGFVNQGLMEAMGAAGLALNGGQFNNHGGTILATGGTNDVALQNGVTVSGGLLESTGGAIVTTTSGFLATLDGSSQGALTLAGTFVTHDNSSTTLEGTINNTGTMLIASSGNTADLRTANGTTLTGSGVVSLGNSTNNRVWGVLNTGTEVLTNLNNTIEGAGSFSISNGIGLDNSGVVSANLSTALTMAMSTSSTIVSNGTSYHAGIVNEASGVLQASGGSLIISSGAVENLGTVQALNNGALAYSASVTNLNVTSGTLTGGAWSAIANGGSAVITVTGGTIATNAADITLSGTGSTLQFATALNNVNIQSSLINNTAAGVLNVLNNQNYTSGKSFTNAGQITLGGGSFTAAGLPNSGTLAGFGTFTTSGTTTLDNNGQIRAAGGTLTLVTALDGTPGALSTAAGAALKIQGTVSGGETFTAAAASRIELTTSAAAQTRIVLPGTGALLALDAPSTFAGTVDMGSVYGGTIDLAGIASVGSSYNATSSAWSVSFTGGSLAVVHVPLGSKVVSATDGGGGTFVSFAAVCFLEGTRIATPDGEAPVQAIQPGDRVLVLEKGQRVPRTVRWTGRRRLDLTRHPHPETARPVRIRAGALGQGIPTRDLLLSPEHCLFIDGGLVPAGRLVNGRSILFDRRTAKITYHHIELDQHGVLLAEGAAAESYLDTGNRGFFENGGAPLSLHPDLSIRTWSDDACAPLIDGAEAVHAIWRRLAGDTAMAETGCATTTDPDVHLLVDGRRRDPVARSGRMLSFAVPAGARSVRLMSRSTQPVTRRPWCGDDRPLGVAVARIEQHWRDGRIAQAVDQAALDDGWHTVETDAGGALWRWTNGNAAMPLAMSGGPMLLEITIEAAMEYEVPEETSLARTG